MNMKPIAYRYVYSDYPEIEVAFFEVQKDRAPVRVDHLYSADQLALAQEAIKIKAALIVRQVLNGDIYADRIRQIEILK